MPLRPIILKGEQKKVLFLPPTEPIQIKGVAGSGKTTVALYRAKHLLETQSNLFKEAKVVIFTYNTTLTAYVNAIKSSISGGYQKDNDEILPGIPNGLNVLVINFDKYAYSFLKGCGIKAYIDRNELSLWKNSTIVDAINYFSKKFPTSNVLKRNIEFFLEEFSWIKGNSMKIKKII